MAAPLPPLSNWFAEQMEEEGIIEFHQNDEDQLWYCLVVDSPCVQGIGETKGEAFENAFKRKTR